VRIRPLRYDALKAHPADVLEHGSAVTRQVFGEPDGAPLGRAEQSGKPSLALDQRQVAQVVAVMLRSKANSTADARKRKSIGTE
jgi:hypothetical protein